MMPVETAGTNFEVKNGHAGTQDLPSCVTIGKDGLVIGSFWVPNTKEIAIAKG